MKTGSTKPEWDTPPDGDFARYVEQLTAPAPAAASKAQAPSPGFTAQSPARASAYDSARPGRPAVSSEFLRALAPLAGALRTVRFVLSLLIAAHAIALWVFSQGSFAGLVLMGIVWWALAWLERAMPKLVAFLPSGSMAGAEPSLALQERLRQVAQQRTTGKKKPQ